MSLKASCTLANVIMPAKTTKKKDSKGVEDFLKRQREFQNSLTQKWKTRLAPELVGQQILKVQYMSKKDAEEMGWYKRPLMLMLSNGTWIIPQQDDEGNDGGALWLMNEGRKLKETLAPVITIDED